MGHGSRLSQPVMCMLKEIEMCAALMGGRRTRVTTHASGQSEMVMTQSSLVHLPASQWVAGRCLVLPLWHSRYPGSVTSRWWGAMVAEQWGEMLVVRSELSGDEAV